MSRRKQRSSSEPQPATNTAEAASPPHGLEPAEHGPSFQATWINGTLIFEPPNFRYYIREEGVETENLGACGVAVARALHVQGQLWCETKSGMVYPIALEPPVEGRRRRRRR